MFIIIDTRVLIVHWSSLSSMKNVDVAWKLIDVVREWPKLKKMTSVLHSHPAFASVCLNSWVLATATIGLKTKQKKPFKTLFAKGNTTDT